MAAPERRFLVIGSTGYGKRVQAHEWDAIPATLNVGDFDVAVLDFVSAFDGKEAVASELPSAEDFGHLLFGTPSTVVAIGHPDARFRTQAGVVSVTWWLPCGLMVAERPGERFDVTSEGWSFWFEHVQRYEWHFRGSNPVSDLYKSAAFTAIIPSANHVIARWNPIAVTRAGAPIAVILDLSAAGPDRIAATNERCTWLPAATELSPHESIMLLLSHVFGVTSRGAAPSWSEAYRLPGEAQAIGKVAAQQQVVEEATGELDARRAEAVEAGRLRGLLYEHDDALETLVYEALEALGATVTPPARAGIEDGRLVDPAGREAMFEVKGNVGPLKVRDVRQLDDWKRTAFFDEGWDGKGLIVANLKLDLPPHERDELFGSQALSTAQRAEIAIMTTLQLYDALRLHQVGELDHDAFWNEVFRAAGPCDLPEIRPTAAPE